MKFFSIIYLLFLMNGMKGYDYSKERFLTARKNIQTGIFHFEEEGMARNLDSMETPAKNVSGTFSGKSARVSIRPKRDANAIDDKTTHVRQAPSNDDETNTNANSQSNPAVYIKKSSRRKRYTATWELNSMTTPAAVPSLLASLKTQVVNIVSTILNFILSLLHTNPLTTFVKFLITNVFSSNSIQNDHSNSSDISEHMKYLFREIEKFFIKK